MQTTSPFFSVWTKRSTLDNLKRISCFLRCKAAHIVIHQELKQNRKVHSSIIVCYLVRYINKASKCINIYIYVCMQFFFFTKRIWLCKQSNKLKQDKESNKFYKLSQVPYQKTHTDDFMLHNRRFFRVVVANCLLSSSPLSPPISKLALKLWPLTFETKATPRWATSSPQSTSKGWPLLAHTIPVYLFCS